MNSYVKGFIEQAKKNGISEKEAMTVLKTAAAADPAIADQAQLQAGVGAPGPESIGGGQPPLPTGGEDSGLPPELEQLINSLPPEVLAQLLQEVEAELQGGGEGGEGSDPNMGNAPEQSKQASVKEDLILAKTAEYQEGFIEASRHYGVDFQTTQKLFKQALDIMEKNPVDLEHVIDTNEKRAAHYEGFVKSAMTAGFSQQDAADIYKETFFN